MNTYPNLKNYFQGAKINNHTTTIFRNDLLLYEAMSYRAASKQYLENLYKMIYKNVGSESLVNIIFKYLNLDIILPRLDCGTFSKKMMNVKEKIKILEKKQSQLAKRRKKNRKRRENNLRKKSRKKIKR